MNKLRTAMHHVLDIRSTHGCAARLLALGLLFASAAVHAGCDPRAFGIPSVKLPALQYQSGMGPQSIVGLWHASYTATDGTQFAYQSFDVWHVDGTEFESADIPPVVGALCVGVWKQIGRTIQLNHFGWTWDPSGLVPTGSFNLLETITLSSDGNSYQGMFDFRPYDTNGNFESAGEHKGTIGARRITVDAHGAD